MTSESSAFFLSSVNLSVVAHSPVFLIEVIGATRGGAKGAEAPPLSLMNDSG